MIGGQITITADVVNYPGIVETDGPKLTEQMRIQAENFGADFLMADVTGLHLDGDYKTVHTSRGDISCLGIVVCSRSPSPLGRIQGGKGISRSWCHVLRYLRRRDFLQVRISSL